jgi:hypothetical protein
MLVSTKMIMGFNTDVRHEGHVYHVQTEDGGEDNRIFESLVYIGGTIVAKKRTPYPAPLSEKASQEKLTSLLRRQHQVIIAAIKAGRIEELIRHSLKQQARKEGKESQSTETVTSPRAAQSVNTVDRINVPARQRAIPSPKRVSASDAAAPVESAASGSLKPVRPSGRNVSGLKAGPAASTSRGDTAGLNLDQVLEDYAKRGAGQARLDVRVLTPGVFTAGSGIGLRVQVTHDAKPDFDATVTVKIIGTAFKPQVFIGRVGRDGVASFSLTLPSFTTGTAAIVIEAQSGIGRGELKNLIRRA